MSISCGYRIYPWWFGFGGNGSPMSELAQHAARRMNRCVEKIEITAEGKDFRGAYIDFKVTYSPTTKEWLMEQST